MNCYKIKGVNYFQDELTFLENEKVNLLFKNNGIDLSIINSTIVGELIDKMYEQGVLKDLFRIILKIDSTTLKKKIENKFYRRKNNLPENIIEVMTNSDIAVVMVDFFLYKIQWLASLMTSLEKSGSTDTKKIAELLSHLKKQSTP